MKLLVTGKAGQVATCLKFAAPARGHEAVFIGRPEFDLQQPEHLIEAIAYHRPDVVISAAAYTAVDKAESEPDLAMIANGDAPRFLARGCKELGIPLVHLSTDYVFDGSKTQPYIETDPVDPINVYGTSKLAGEQGVAEETDNHVILRTAWVYSPFGSNFVKTMLRLAERGQVRVVADQLGNPTSAMDIADVVLGVAEQVAANNDPALRGVFHTVGEGDASWADLAEAIFAHGVELGRPAVSVERIASHDYPTPAKRPVNSRMDCTRLRSAYGLALPPWRLSLRRVLDKIELDSSKA